MTPASSRSSAELEQRPSKPWVVRSNRTGSTNVPGCRIRSVHHLKSDAETSLPITSDKPAQTVKS